MVPSPRLPPADVPVGPRAIDKTQVGTLEDDFAGVLPFPCAVGSPSGAFLDLTE